MKRLHTNFCPLCQSAVQYGHVLNIAAPLPRWRVKCHEGAWVHFTSDKDGQEHVVYMEKATRPPVPHEWGYVDNQNVIKRSVYDD